MTARVPFIKNVFNVVNAMKNLSPEITIAIKPNEGSLSFYIEQSEYKTKSVLGDLRIVDNLNDDDQPETICKVASKRMSAALANNVFKAVPVIISIKKDYLFKLEFEIRQRVSLHYIIPALHREE